MFLMLGIHCVIYLFYFIFGCVGSFVAVQTRNFSNCDEQGLLSGCSAWPSHCSGFSLVAVLGLLIAGASLVVEHGL